MKKVLVIDNYDSFVYNVVQLLRETEEPIDYDIVRNDEIDFSKLNRYGGILLSPGPGIPNEAGDLLKVIAECKNTHSILGICLGHQAIAETFGASLLNLPRPLHGYAGVLHCKDTDDPILRGLKEPIRIGHYHSWVIDYETMPNELIVSSVDDKNNIMSFRHIELPIYGVQFHPESYISNCGHKIIENWLATIR